MNISRRDSLHAARNTQGCADSCENRNDDLNDLFPSFLFHFHFYFLVGNYFLLVESNFANEQAILLMSKQFC